jgi:hypothetical protein
VVHHQLAARVPAALADYWRDWRRGDLLFAKWPGGDPEIDHIAVVSDVDREIRQPYLAQHTRDRSRTPRAEYAKCGRCSVVRLALPRQAHRREHPGGPPMRLRLRSVVPGILAVVAVGVLVYRDNYDNWPWDSAPDRLSWCGRTYLHRSGTTGAPREQLHPVFRAPPVIGRQVFATVTAEQAERRQRAGEICEFALYVRTDDDRYAPYSRGRVLVLPAASSTRPVRLVRASEHWTYIGWFRWQRRGSLSCVGPADGWSVGRNRLDTGDRGEVRSCLGVQVGRL